VLILCLPDGDVVEAVLLGPDGLAARGRGLGAGRRAGDRGVEEAQAPARERPAEAHRRRVRAATLTVMCGGTPEDFAAAEPLLARIGTQVLHMGPKYCEA
jgi:3-hydroxyisobutyrate dehydrogenase-like beta-hydroxyacid dehydrogenase